MFGLLPLRIQSALALDGVRIGTNLIISQSAGRPHDLRLQHLLVKYIGHYRCLDHFIRISEVAGDRKLHHLHLDIHVLIKLSVLRVALMIMEGRRYTLVVWVRYK